MRSSFGCSLVGYLVVLINCKSMPDIPDMVICMAANDTDITHWTQSQVMAPDVPHLWTLFLLQSNFLDMSIMAGNTEHDSPKTYSPRDQERAVLQVSSASAAVIKLLVRLCAQAMPVVANLTRFSALFDAMQVTIWDFASRQVPSAGLCNSAPHLALVCM